MQYGGFHIRFTNYTSALSQRNFKKQSKQTPFREIKRPKEFTERAFGKILSAFRFHSFEDTEKQDFIILIF